MLYKTSTRFEREQTKVFTYEMEIRRRQRLLGLTPEVDEFKDKCSIPQGDLAIDSLAQCRGKPNCCGKFLLMRCFQQEFRNLIRTKSDFFITTSKQNKNKAKHHHKASESSINVY